MKRYKVLIIGAGRIGAFFDTVDSKAVLTHAHAFFQAEQFELVGFFDSVKENAKKAAERWNTNCFENLEKALEVVEVVCCTVPDAYHYEILKKIAGYKNVKFVFGEKPITENVEQAEEICSLYQNRKIPLQINYTRRYLEEFWQLKEEIQGYGRLLKGCGYYGKGILHNGSHMLDLIRNLLGEIESTESLDKIYDYYEKDPSVDAKLQIGDANIYLHSVDCGAVTIFELDLLFEKARIRILDGGAKIEVYSVLSSEVYEGYFNYKLIDIREVNYDKSFINAVNNIYEYLEYGKALLCPMEEAKEVLELCCKLQK